jgi:hypothetical protein
MQPLQKYSNSFTTYESTQYVLSNCNTIVFVNIGIGTVTINQTLPISSGASFTFGGNNDEICIDTFLITITGESKCLVIKKTYVD